MDGTVLAVLSSDVGWVLEGPAVIPYAGRWHGIDGVAGFLTAMVTTPDTHAVVTQSVIAQADQVITAGRFSGTVKATDKAFECANAHVLTLREGKVTRFLDFADTAQVAAAYTAG